MTASPGKGNLDPRRGLMRPAKPAPCAARGAGTVLDGPFAETKEQLLGFYVLDCASEDAAIDAARDLRRVNPGAVYEIRPISLYLPGAAIPTTDAVRPADKLKTCCLVSFSSRKSRRTKRPPKARYQKYCAYCGAKAATIVPAAGRAPEKTRRRIRDKGGASPATTARR